MGTIDGGGVKTRELSRWISDEGDVLRIEDAFLTQLQIQTSAIMRSTNVLVSYDISNRCEDPEHCEDHWIRDSILWKKNAPSTNNRFPKT